MKMTRFSGSHSKQSDPLILTILSTEQTRSANIKNDNCFIKKSEISGKCMKTLRTFYKKDKYKNPTIQSLLKEAISVEGDRLLQVAVLNEDLKTVQKLCFLMKKNSVSLDSTNYLKQTPLHLAVALGNAHIINLLLSFGASPLVFDRNGNSVLHLALKSNCADVLKVLLRQEKIKSVINGLDHKGYDVLHYAVMKGNEEAVKILHSSGADMNKRDGKSGRTSLIYAVLWKNVSMVKLLLQLGSCPRKADFSGRTALDMALQIGHLPLFKLLESLIAERNNFFEK